MANIRASLGVIAFGHLCELLCSKAPNSRKWFREQIGVGDRTMDKFFRVLKNRKLIYVSYWSTGGKRSSTRIAMWTWGYNQPDADKPKPIPRSVVNRNSKRRRRLAAQNGVNAQV